MEVKLGIIVVSYKNPTLTAKFVREELTKLTIPFDLIIVNNASTTEECDALADACQVNRSCVICSPENLGYAKGNNLGVKALMEKRTYTHFLFTNDDIKINEKDVVQCLLNRMDQSQDIAAIGPRILGLDGKDQSPHDRYISPYRQIGWKLFSIFRKKSVVMKATATPQSRYTYWVQGSFLMVDAAAFVKAGLFDPNTFLYFEEPILAERLNRIGKKMYFESSVSVLHMEGQSTRMTPNKIAIENQSRNYYYKNYKMVSPFLLWMMSKIVY